MILQSYNTVGIAKLLKYVSGPRFVQALFGINQISICIKFSKKENYQNGINAPNLKKVPDLQSTSSHYYKISLSEEIKQLVWLLKTCNSVFMKCPISGKLKRLWFWSFEFSSLCKVQKYLLFFSQLPDEDPPVLTGTNKTLKTRRA